MVLEIWAQETKENTTDLKINKNRRSIPLFNSNRETISLNEHHSESFNSGVIENIQFTNQSTTGFARDDVKSYNNISQLTSNGYYGYSSNLGDNSLENNCTDSGTVMDIDLNNSNPQLARRKRCFTITEEMTTQNYQKKFKYDEDEYENFRQSSFDPNGTSISFNNEVNNDKIHNCLQIETEMMQTNEAEILQIKYPPVEETNQFTLLKQKSFTEYKMKETQTIHKNNIKNKFDLNNSYSTCKYNDKNICKKLKTNTENLLENLFLLTHGGSNYQMWQHYNINIDT